MGLLRQHDRWLAEIATTLRTRPEGAAEAVRERELERRRLEKELKRARSGGEGENDIDIGALVGEASELDGALVLTQVVSVPDAKTLLQVLDRVKGRLGDAAIVLGTAVDGRVHLVASVAPALVERGVKAGSVVKLAAEVVGGGGGGRDTMAQAGGSKPDRLNQAIEAAKSAIGQILEG